MTTAYRLAVSFVHYVLLGCLNTGAVGTETG